MSDFVIDECRWHLEAEPAAYRLRSLEHFRDRYTVLLGFLRAEGLLRDPTFGTSVADWSSFEFRASHLTDEGLSLVMRCHGRWNPAFGQGHTQRQLTLWKRELTRIRAA